jgi:hypothetical protein
MKTNVERVLDYLWSVDPQGATNAQIREVTGIEPHQQVYMITQDLKFKGQIESRRLGREWVFFVGESPNKLLQSPGRAAPSTPLPKLNAAQFEDLARQIFSQRFGAPLRPGQAKGVPKQFDLVSLDGDIIGDAKYFTLVNGQHLPPAKFSIIAEHVWLLEKTQARHKFLVFGNDIEVPKRWLSRYGHLRGDVAFYFLTDEGEIVDLDRV